MISKQQLGNTLWGMAEILYDKVEDYKTYILSLLFSSACPTTGHGKLITRYANILPLMAKSQTQNSAQHLPPRHTIL